MKNEITFAVGFTCLSEELSNLPLTYNYSTEVGEHQDKSFPYGWENWPEKYILSGQIYQGYLFTRELVTKFLNKGTKLFFNADQVKYFKKINLFNISDEKIFFLKQRGGLIEPRSFQNTDLTKRFVGMSGSVLNSLLILIHMGIEEIYLCGAGYTYSPIYEMHFYDTFTCSTDDYSFEQAKELAEEFVTELNVKNNVDLKLKDLYLKNNQYRAIYSREYPEDELAVKHRLVKEIAELFGVTIKNVVPNGFESPVYEKISWPEVLEIIEN